VYEQERQAVIDAGRKLDDYRLISLSGGNVSLRLGDHFLVTPSGMGYEGLVPSDICVVDREGNLIEGARRPSVDSVALLHIFKEKPGVNAIIHTHQVYATAIGLVQDQLPAAVTTLINATLGPVNVAPYSSAASLDMGVKTVEHLGESRAVILRNHGVVTVGSSLKEALYAAVYLEDAAKTYCVARMIGEPAELTPSQIQEAVAVFEDYGQDTEKG
jgi:L-ribulose-5-phosphate 4-epimerase